MLDCARLAAQMVELASKMFVCIVDESKLVSGLGGSKGAHASSTRVLSVFMRACVCSLQLLIPSLYCLQAIVCVRAPCMQILCFTAGFMSTNADHAFFSK